MRAVAALVARLPYAWLRRLGAGLGALVGGVLRVRRRQVVAAMRRAGLATEGEAGRDPTEALAARMYASLGAGLLELLWLAGRPASALDEIAVFTARAAARLAEAAAAGRGVVIATAHTGNWDLAACATARWLAAHAGEGTPARLAVATRRLSWRALDRYWQGLRAERGVDLLDGERAGAARAIGEVLGAAGAVALLVDQVPLRAGGAVSLPFLGAPAFHDLAPALLAARARAPIAIAFARRGGDGRHVLDVVEVLPPPKGRAGAREATARIAASLEAFVREHPEQWLWLHRRWKALPK